MAALRFLAGLCALIAVVALVADATHSLGAGRFAMTPLREHWLQFAPATLTSAQAAVAEAAAPWVWDGLVAPVLSVPTFLMFAGLALLLGWLGRRRRRVQIYAN